jgi:hypothetical protein
MITSILYLNRANHIVTTSLDSTAKFWKLKFKHEKGEDGRPGLELEEAKRMYSNECIYLNSKSNVVVLDNEGCRI